MHSQLRTEAVREVFLDFFVSVLRPYRRYLTVPTAETIQEYSSYYVEVCGCLCVRVRKCACVCLCMCVWSLSLSVCVCACSV